MLTPSAKNPEIRIKTFDIKPNYPVNEFLKDMRFKIKVLDIQVSNNFIVIVYEWNNDEASKSIDWQKAIDEDLEDIKPGY